MTNPIGDRERDRLFGADPLGLDGPPRPYGRRGAEYGEYDWLSPHSTRTPDEYPYAYSEHYVWRDFKSGDGAVQAHYTDRMREWDGPKWRYATRNDRLKNYQSEPVHREAAQAVVSDYFGPEFECVGFAKSCNQSSGYPLGIFFVRKRK